MKEPGFVADFNGDCSRCPNPIRPGQRVISNHGTYIHVACASGQDD